MTFFIVLEDIVSKKNLGATQIWNCDESGFPHDPQKCKVVSVKGETAFKLTCGAGRENTTTLAAVCASGRVLDPLIIFSGKNFQSTWRGKDALPKTLYGVSDNGWMTTEIFSEWFENFCEQVNERPLLLVLDGHLTHVSIPIIERALNEDITILKFPPHVTDLLQPADVTCFGPLKRKWEKKLNEYVNIVGASKGISKATFGDLIAAVWHQGLTPDNVIAGFRKTGIYPVDRTKFPTHRLDARLVRRYDQWVQLGKPDDLMEELAMALTTPKKIKENGMRENGTSGTENDISATRKHNDKEDSTREESVLGEQSIMTPMASTPNKCLCNICERLGPEPAPMAGKIWTPIWVPLDLPKCSEQRSFEEIALGKMKGPKKGPNEKRRKVHIKTKIISDVELLEELKQQEREKQEKEERKKLVIAKKRKAQKRIDFESEEEIDEDKVGDDVSEGDNITEETEEEIIEEDSEEEENDDDEEALKNVWQKLSPPNTEESILQQWYCGIYKDNRKEYLYVGKSTKRFLDDVDGPVSGIELDCLKLKVGSGTVLESYGEGNPDIGIFSIYDVIDGPITVVFKGNRQWDVPNYEVLKEKFMRVKNINRQEIFLLSKNE